MNTFKPLSSKQVKKLGKLADFIIERRISGSGMTEWLKLTDEAMVKMNNFNYGVGHVNLSFDERTGLGTCSGIIEIRKCRDGSIMIAANRNVGRKYLLNFLLNN